MKKRIVYGVADYEELVEKNGYFVDKTAYIETLEQVENPVFLRPRRFGKSLWCRILEFYYSIIHQDDFERLFGQTYIGQNPTPLRNSFIVLHLDFSIIDPNGSIEEIERRFNYMCNLHLQMSVMLAKQWFEAVTPVDFNQPVDLERSVLENLSRIMLLMQLGQLPKLYVIIDEYDNFANQLITAHKDHIYQALTADDGFLKTFFKLLKEGRKSGSIANVYVTGVLPITMDDLASAFNIATFITLDPIFEGMLGFTQDEVDHLIEQVYRDYELDSTTQAEVKAVIKNHYNGYQFTHLNSESLYNSTILLYFLRYFTQYRQIPKHLTDQNLKTDISWIKRLTASNTHLAKNFVDRLIMHNNIRYDEQYLIQQFNRVQFFDEPYFPISFFYLGMLTKEDDYYLKLPNLNMRQIFIEYFNELHQIDVSTRYTEFMQAFSQQPNLENLFAGYWEHYVSQLPEAIFQQVNENFYRTTFFELCSRYLSRWFTWNVERSYPQGRSDLEFVGKYHEKYAGLRWVIEFKYYSKAAFKKLKTSLEDFELQAQDTTQIVGYVEGLRQEYPEAQISQFVIYCIGNEGFRVFSV